MTPLRGDLVHQWLAAIGRVEVATAVLHAAVDAVVSLMRHGRKEQAAGRDLGEVVPELIALGGIEARLAVAEAVEEWERAMTAYRGVAVRVLLDAGMTAVEVAELFGVSRQMISKLMKNSS